jgi:hypothetical protein
MKELFTSSTIIQRNESGFLASNLGNETVMMNLDNGDYLGLNSVASDIWKILKEPIALENLYAQIIHMYDVTEDQCKLAVNNFLMKLSEQKMLVIHNTIE